MINTRIVQEIHQKSTDKYREWFHLENGVLAKKDFWGKVLFPDETAEIPGTAGVKIPSGTTAERPLIAEDGTIRYNSENGQVELSVDNNWLDLSKNVVVDNAEQLLTSDKHFVENKVIITNEEGFVYRVANPDATDHHVETNAGVKLYVISRPLMPEAFGHGLEGQTVSEGTVILRKVLSLAGDIKFKRGKTYLVHPIDETGLPSGILALGCLPIYPNTNLDFRGATIKLHETGWTPTTLRFQQIFYPSNMITGETPNVVIDFRDGVIDGNRAAINWSSVGGDGTGHGITTWGGVDWTVYPGTTMNCYTDGIYVTPCRTMDATTPTRRFTLKAGGVHIGHRRQGLSVIAVDGINIETQWWINIGQVVGGQAGTAPRAAIDFEPNLSSAIFENINVEHQFIENCGAGILFAALSPTQMRNCHVTSFDASVTNTQALLINQANVVIGGMNATSTSTTWPLIDVEKGGTLTGTINNLDGGLVNIRFEKATGDPTQHNIVVTGQFKNAYHRAIVVGDGCDGTITFLRKDSVINSGHGQPGTWRAVEAYTGKFVGMGVPDNTSMIGSFRPIGDGCELVDCELGTGSGASFTRNGKLVKFTKTKIAGIEYNGEGSWAFSKHTTEVTVANNATIDVPGAGNSYGGFWRVSVRTATVSTAAGWQGVFSGEINSQGSTNAPIKSSLSGTKLEVVASSGPGGTPTSDRLYVYPYASGMRFQNLGTGVNMIVNVEQVGGMGI